MCAMCVCVFQTSLPTYIASSSSRCLVLTSCALVQKRHEKGRRVGCSGGGKGKAGGLGKEGAKKNKTEDPKKSVFAIPAPSVSLREAELQ